MMSSLLNRWCTKNLARSREKCVLVTKRFRLLYVAYKWYKRNHYAAIMNYKPYTFDYIFPTVYYLKAPCLCQSPCNLIVHSHACMCLYSYIKVCSRDIQSRRDIAQTVFLLKWNLRVADPLDHQYFVHYSKEVKGLKLIKDLCVKWVHIALG